jgi:hypothetical protein
LFETYTEAVSTNNFVIRPDELESQKPGGRYVPDLRAKVCWCDEKNASRCFARSFQTNNKFAMSINFFACLQSGATRALKLLRFRPTSACA